MKHIGKGLGLSSANHLMQKLKGTLKLSSEPDRGTEVILTFPIAPKPCWFPEHINIFLKAPMVILDDDVNIHNLWRDKLQLRAIETKYFFKPEKFLEWYRERINYYDQIIVLTDYELHNEAYNGLDVLRLLNVKNNGYLITHHSDNSAVRRECENLGVWLIPKNIICDIPLNIIF